MSKKTKKPNLKNNLKEKEEESDEKGSVSKAPHFDSQVPETRSDSNVENSKASMDDSSQTDRRPV